MKREAVKMCPIRPAPNTIVSCRDKDGRNNALVVGFVSNVSISPSMVMIGIVPERFSYHMIKETGVFVINLPGKGFEKEYSYLGSKSGRDGDKFEALNLAWEEGTKVCAPLLSACPVNIECKVLTSIQVGEADHELFIGSVEAVHCDEEYLDKNGNIAWEKLALI